MFCSDKEARDRALAMSPMPASLDSKVCVRIAVRSSSAAPCDEDGGSPQRDQTCARISGVLLLFEEELRTILWEKAGGAGFED